MSADAQPDLVLEIAHVLFLDIVGYSKLSINEQHARIQELNEIVRESEQFRKAEAASRILKRFTTRCSRSIPATLPHGMGWLVIL